MDRWGHLFRLGTEGGSYLDRIALYAKAKEKVKNFLFLDEKGGYCSK